MRIMTHIAVGVLLALAAVLFGAAGCFAWLYATADMMEPNVAFDARDYALTVQTDSLRVCRGHSLCRNEYGLWEARIAGSPTERGAALGALSRDLLDYQERVFVGQIRRFVPSERYLRFLHALIAVFNRRMAAHIPEEYRTEIAALARSCSRSYDAFGTPYERQLNYHAAHDIGHAMQEYMLVGCSSFAVWGHESADGRLLVGRNFDFYVGDDFARNKEVLFVAPQSGYRYASVTWPGMLGVVSGMNEKGLTVTINAGKGPLPTSSAMPVSLLARHMLQYAATLDEARAIADSCRTFVSESFLVGSVADGCAAVIEKTPGRMGVCRSTSERIVCTNHFQSEAFVSDPHNLSNIDRSDSRYRFDRLSELLTEQAPLTPARAVAVLRDRCGRCGCDIGLTNEKSINQCIAHHAVVFAPSELRMWVSTDPWQAGAFVCYDLRAVFDRQKPVTGTLADAARTLAADSVFLARDYARVRLYRRQAAAVREAVASGTVLPEGFIDGMIRNNPRFYGTYELCGDYLQVRGDRSEAVACWKQALTRELPHADDRERLERKIRKYDTR